MTNVNVKTKAYLRIVSPRDIDEVFRLEKECFPSDGYKKNELSYYINCRHSRFFGLCEVKGDASKFIGYVLYGFYKKMKSLHIIGLAVDPKYQGKGFGRQMMEYPMEESKFVDEMRLEVNVHNVVAINLYYSLGFRKTSIKKNYYKDGSDAVEMVRVNAS